MDYDVFNNMADVEAMYKTARGSTYAHMPDGTTIRNRSGANHSDTTTGLQPASTKTLYMDPKATNAVGAWIQNDMTATRLVPEMKDGKFTGHALVQMMEDHEIPKSKYMPEGKSYTAGETVSRVPVSLKPAIGMHPVEIYGSAESPKGSKARNIHFGNQITEVLPRGGGAPRSIVPPVGGGGYRPGVDNVQHSLNPLKMATGGAIVSPLPGGHKLI
jgi:hypothetical protein